MVRSRNPSLPKGGKRKSGISNKNCLFFDCFWPFLNDLWLKSLKNDKNEELRSELIANPSYGMKELGLARVLFEDLAEVENVVVDGAGRGTFFCGP